MELVDVVFAYCVEARCMLGDFSCESATTINRLSSVLSCFTCDESIEAIVVESYRRALTLSLIRNFEVVEKAKQDAAKIFASGKVALIKVLVEVKEMLEASDPRYHLNNIYVNDAIVWVKSPLVDNAEIQAVAKLIHEIKVKKQDLGLNLI